MPVGELGTASGIHRFDLGMWYDPDFLLVTIDDAREGKRRQDEHASAVDARRAIAEERKLNRELRILEPLATFLVVANITAAIVLDASWWWVAVPVCITAALVVMMIRTDEGISGLRDKNCQALIFFAMIIIWGISTLACVEEHVNITTTEVIKYIDYDADGNIVITTEDGDTYRVDNRVYAAAGLTTSSDEEVDITWRSWPRNQWGSPRPVTRIKIFTSK
jgi:hypothetical protein